MLEGETVSKYEGCSKNELISQLISLEHELEKLRKIAAINETLLKISELAHDHSLSIDEFYESVCKVLSSVIDTSNFYIARLKRNGEILSFDFYKDTYGIQFEYEHDFPIRPYGKGLTEMVIDGGKSILLSQNDIEVITSAGLITRRRKKTAHSWLGSPLTFNNEKLGAIVVQSYKSNYTFSKEAKNLFAFVSQHIASAIARYEQKQALKINAKTDSLTGLLNRSAFLDALEEIINARSGLYQSCVLFIDLDGFKAVNDTYGHEIGDEVLVLVSKVITAEIRDIDCVGRFGGDEFVVLMSRLQRKSDAKNAAERILEALNKPILVNNKLVHIGASIGIAYENKRHIAAEELIKDADLAMYRAKKRGKRQYSIAE